MKTEYWGEKLEELINDIRRDNSTDSVHIHEFVRSLIKDCQKRQMLWLTLSKKKKWWHFIPN